MNKTKSLRKLLVVMILCLATALCSCGKKVIIDYGDAESFEAALNDGEKCEGKVVRFVVDELKPDSKLGYNVCAGEHLNFISSENPGYEVGDTVTVEVTSVENLLGSWIIEYEEVKNAEVGDDTITYSGSDKSQEEVSDSEESPEETTTTTTTAAETTTTTTTAAETTTTTTAAAEAPAESEAEVELVDGMRPDFKEAMDTLETFFDGYCEFMKKYMENPTDLGLLTEYTTWLSDYNEAMGYLDQFGDADLNEAELAYYIEVCARIEKKLLEVVI